MSRLDLILLFNAHLKGYARRTRVRAGGIADYFVFYLRQIVRYRLPRQADCAREALFKLLRDEVHEWGGDVLRALDRDKAEGGRELKAAMAEAVLESRLILRPQWKAYRKHFRGSKVTTHLWERYNTALFTLAVAEGILRAHDPAVAFVPEGMTLNLGTGEIGKIAAEHYPQQLKNSHFMREALFEIGWRAVMWDKRTDGLIRFDHYLVLHSQLFTVGMHAERFGMRKWWVESMQQHRELIDWDAD